MNNLLHALLTAIVAAIRPSTVTDDSSNRANVDDVDFDRYQRGLISLNRRLDAIEATLGGLAALEIVAMTYMLEKAAGDRFSIEIIFGAMVTAIAIALLGVLGFQGDEIPNLTEFDAERRRDRKEAIESAIRSMTETYGFNGEQVRLKSQLRFASAWITTVAGAFFAIHVLEWLK